MATIAADTRSDREEPDPEQVRRGRRTALLLFAAGFGPMILATLMYVTGWLNPAGHTNEGMLVQPLLPVEQLSLETAAGEPFSARFGAGQTDPQWYMLVVSEHCGSDCERLLYLSRQVNIALGKNAPRVSRTAWLGSLPGELESRWQAEYRLMERLQVSAGSLPAWPEGVNPAEQPGLLLVDPFGNVMMRYGPDHTGKQLLKDLKRLLKLSQVG